MASLTEKTISMIKNIMGVREKKPDLPQQKLCLVVVGLPEDSFVIVDINNEGGLSRCYRIEVTLASDNPSIDMAKVVKSRVFGFSEETQGDVKIINGYVYECEQLGEFEGKYFYRVIVGPKLWSLTQTFHNQIFLDRTTPEILAEILTDGGLLWDEFELRLHGEYSKKWEYVCQYRESHYDFFARWLEREGIYFFFESTAADGEKLIITDSIIAHPSAPALMKLTYHPKSGLENANSVPVLHTFTASQLRAPGSVTVKDYNYRRPSLDLTGTAVVDPASTGDVYLYGDHLQSPEESTRIAKIRAEAIACRSHLFKGSTNAPHLRAGLIVEVVGHFRSEYNRRYLITEMTHEANQQMFLFSGLQKETSEREKKPQYRNSFTAIPADMQYRPTPSTEKPRFHGVINAHIDASGSGQYAELDNEGRYKVRLPFDLAGRRDGKASAWIRMAQPYAGENHGMHFPLHKGTEVLLTFVDGDPDRPIIASAVPNPLTPSVVNDALGTQSRITTAGGNKMHIEDQKDGERILLQTPRHNSWIRMGTPNDPPGIAMPRILRSKDEGAGGSTQETAIVKVLISPSVPGAKWRIDNGEWLLVDCVECPVGKHTITFLEVSGYKTPSQEAITLDTKGYTHTFSYEKLEKVDLTVTLSAKDGTTEECDTIASSAGWSADPEEEWNNSGTTVSLYAGTYTINFNGVTGWLEPLPVEIELQKGKPATHQYQYEKLADKAALTVVIEPDEVNGMGASWTLSKLENGTLTPKYSLLPSGKRVTLDPGNYQVTCADAAGWIKPDPVQITIGAGAATTEKTVEYTATAEAPVYEKINEIKDEMAEKEAEAEEEKHKEGGLRLNTDGKLEFGATAENKMIRGEQLEFVLGNVYDVLIGTETSIKAAEAVEMMLGMSADYFFGGKVEYSRGFYHTYCYEGELSGRKKVEILSGGSFELIDAFGMLIAVLAIIDTIAVAATGLPKTNCDPLDEEKEKEIFVDVNGTVYASLLALLETILLIGSNTELGKLTYQSKIKMDDKRIKIIYKHHSFPPSFISEITLNEDIEIKRQGSVVFGVTSEIKMYKKGIKQTSEGAIKQQAKTDVSVKAGGAITQTAGGAIAQTAGGAIALTATGPITLTSGPSVVVSTKESLTLTNPTNITLTSASVSVGATATNMILGSAATNLTLLGSMATISGGLIKIG